MPKKIIYSFLLMYSFDAFAFEIYGLKSGITKSEYLQLVDCESSIRELNAKSSLEPIEVLEQRLQRLQAQSNAAAENFGLIQQEQDIVAPLVEKGVESQMELIRLKQRLNEAQSNIFQIDAEIEATNAQLKAEQSSSNFKVDDCFGGRYVTEGILKYFSGIMPSISILWNHEDRLWRVQLSFKKPEGIIEGIAFDRALAESFPDSEIKETSTTSQFGTTDYRDYRIITFIDESEYQKSENYYKTQYLDEINFKK